MVAFRYDNATGSVIARRKSVALRGLHRPTARPPASSHSSRTARSILVRGRGFPAGVPGFRDIRGYRAMYRDFAARSATSRAGGCFDAIEDQRLMDQIYATIGLRRPSYMHTSGMARPRDVIIHRQRRRRRNHGAGAVEQFRPDPSCSSEAGGASEPDNWNPGGLEASPPPRTERWLETRGRVPAVHIRRRRQHEVLGRRAHRSTRGLSGDGT